MKEIERNPAKERGTDRILKKKGDPITLEQFRKYLELISWRLRYMGCESYNIVTHHEKCTAFRVEEKSDGLEMNLFDEEAVFGESFKGNIYVGLDSCEIRISDGSLFIYIEGNTKNDRGISIHLSNFDQPYSEKELFVEDQPKDFQLRQKCSKCGEYSKTESKPISAFEIWLKWTMIVMGRGFSTPKCHKCKESTFSDMNISTDLVIWDLKNDKEVEFEHIHKIAEKLKWKYKKLSDNPANRLIEDIT